VPSYFFIKSELMIRSQSVYRYLSYIGLDLLESAFLPFLGRITALAMWLLLAWSVGRSVATVSPAKVAEPIVMPLRIWTRLGPRNHELDGVQGAVLRAKKDRPRMCLVVDILKATQQGAEPVQCACQLGCTRWGAHWCYLAYMIEPSVCGWRRCGLCNITLTTC